MATATSHRIGRDEIVWAFEPNMEPVLEVDPGSTITLETNDCFTGQIQSEADLVTAIDFQRVNSATGPIAVRGAKPGDSLVVELLEINPGPRGAAMIIPGFGQLIGHVESPVTRIFSVVVGPKGHVFAVAPAPRPDAPAGAPDRAAAVRDHARCCPESAAQSLGGKAADPAPPITGAERNVVKTLAKNRRKSLIFNERTGATQ